MAAIGYDAVQSHVWLDPLGNAPDAQMLCSVHAERLRAPRGWVVVDRRSPQTVIVSPSTPPEPEVAAAAAAPPAAPRRRWGQLKTSELEFSREPDLDEPVADVDDGPHDPPAPVEPTADEPTAAEPGSELDGELDGQLDGDAESTDEVASEESVEDSDDRDDLEPLLEPKGRLLSRAFSTGGPQRSVLSVPNEEPEDS